MQDKQKIRIGLISDTHGLLRPAALQALAGVDLILHAGDVGDPLVLEGLAALAPLHAIRGNIDVDGPCASLPDRLDLQIAGIPFLILHDRKELKAAPAEGVVLFGHSHKPLHVQEGALHWINPGSAGKRRFSLPISLAIAEIEDGKLELQFVDLAEMERQG